jgi:hypothetical protein
VPLLQGRDFLPADLAAPRATDTLTPVVVSRSFAGRFLPNGEAIGRTFESTDRRGVRRFQIIGIAGDVSQWGLMMPSCANCDPFIYEPLPDQRAYTEVLLRLRPGVAPPTAALQAAVATVDPDVPSDDELGTSEASLEDFISTPRFTASLFAAFAALAIALVAIGLSTVVSRSVKERTREMGIRLALGATPRSVRGLIVREGLRPALLGLGLGVVTALGVTRTIRSLLYGTSPADPVTLVLAPALLLTIVLAALIVPALRATRVDPARTLREE